MQSSLPASHSTFIAERPPGADEDVHMIAEIVDSAITVYSSVGASVFDPFAGFGTTLDRAVALGRKAAGIELLPERVAHIQARIPGAKIVEGDARELGRLVDGANFAPSPGFDLVLTSPPYMTVNDHEADPLTAYIEDGGDYARYLAELELVAAQCARVVKPQGFVVWNVADIHYYGRTTHLIADCETILGRHLTHVRTTPIKWDQLPHDLVADALLVFQR